jgi:DHA3 family macrolide efflux protein-like MFS transporter
MLTSPQTAPSADLPIERIGSAFYLIWIGQFVSMMGTMLTSFALGVWLFQRTGSVLDFANLTLFSTLPALLLMPFSGSVADRFDKRTILIAGEAVALACTAVMGLLFWTGRFEVWQLFALQTLMSVSMAFQGPAAYAAISSLVPKSQFGRASGMFQISSAVSQLAAPLIAASVLGAIGIAGIVLIDTLTFSVALLGIVLARFPDVARKSADAAKARRGAFQDLRWAFNFLRERPTVAALYGYTSVSAFLSGMVTVLISPMVLSNYSAQVLAWVTTCGGVGVLCGGLLMVAWGGPKSWTPHVLAFNLVQGLTIAFAGISNSVTVLCAGAFIVMFSSTALAGCMAGVWRRKVPRERQGSFGALQQAVGLSVIPLSAVLGGVLAHYLFEPALLSGGIWFDSVGAWFGQGKGRGTGFLFFVVGVTGAAVALFSLSHRRLYLLDTDVKDAI